MKLHVCHIASSWDMPSVVGGGCQKLRQPRSKRSVRRLANPDWRVGCHEVGKPRLVLKQGVLGGILARLVVITIT